jgi:hypothetical protein
VALSCMPGGYFSGANFVELRFGEVRILGFLGSTLDGGQRTLG